MFVTARVVVGDGEVASLVVPKSALQTVEEKTVVFVETPQGFEAKPVQTGRSNATHVEITSGLSAGATYALAGTFTLKAQLSKSAFGDGHGH
jgi:cobalt-zinc-cadmium efflux system membrane fusion protein